MKISPSHPQPAAVSTRDRALMGGALAVIGVCVLSLGSLYWALHAPPPKPEHKLVWVNPATPPQLDAMLDKGKWLRERFRKWGTAHRADLLALRGGQPDDMDTLRRVMRDLPDDPTPENAGFEADDLMFDPKGDPSNGFCWNIANHPLPVTENQRNDSQAQERMAKGQTILDRIAQRNWQTQHDIALGFSTLRGPVRYTLWASGRITQTQVPQQSKDDPMLETTEREVVPAYDL